MKHNPVTLILFILLTGCNLGGVGRSNQKSPLSNLESAHGCDTQKPLDLVIAVDNTGSNSCTPGLIQDPSQGLCGTDPVKRDSVHPEGYTDRQSAIYSLFISLIQGAPKSRVRIGLMSFPKSSKEDDLNTSVFYSGNSDALPNNLTAISDLADTPSFQNGLWKLLDFTHKPEGLTPYSTALHGARRLLSESPADTAKAIILVTDGLPTDERPSAVLELRHSLDNIPVILVSLYSPGKNDEEQNANAKKTLLELWSSDRAWAHRVGDSDGYRQDEFAQYWRDLMALPRQIASHYLHVDGSENLTKNLMQALHIAQGCTTSEENGK